MEKKLDLVMMSVLAVMMNTAQNVKDKALNALTAKREGMEGFVVVIIICIIALAVAIVFRDGITAWFNNVMVKFTTETNALF